MASGPTPLWRALRDALTERGVSVRRLSKMLHERDPRQTEASWKRTLNRYLDEDAEPPTVPSPETAALLSELLDYPDGYFVRQQQRETAREEVARLRAEVAELRRRLGEDQGVGGSAGLRA